MLEITLHFEQNYAVELIKRIFDVIKSKQDDDYFTISCIEALERIGGDESKAFLREYLDIVIEEKHIIQVERTFRALNIIATSDDEDWYIKIIKSNPYLEGSDLRRALEGLSITGSDKSLGLLKMYAVKNKDNEYIFEACIRFIENIYAKRGKRFYVTEEYLYS